MRWCSFILCRPIWKYHTALARLPQTSLLCGTLLHMERSGHEKKSERGGKLSSFQSTLVLSRRSVCRRAQEGSVGGRD